MNKVIYALLRGWPWVLIGPRLSLSLSISFRALSAISLCLPRRLPHAVSLDPSCPIPAFFVLPSPLEDTDKPSFRPPTEGWFLVTRSALLKKSARTSLEARKDARIIEN